MKKAEALLESLVHCDLRTSVGVDEARKLIRRALKEQDRDTRHACAEAVCAIVPESFSKDEVYIEMNKAHAACMNVRKEEE